jgi:hypothetical protein
MKESTTQEARVSDITPQVKAWLADKAQTATGSFGDFIFDMHMAVSEDRVTPNQEAAILKCFAKDQERVGAKAALEAKLATAPKLVSGKGTFLVKIASPQYREGQFGTQVKTIYEFANGNRLWGTIPAKVLDAFSAHGDLDAVRGKIVALNGTIEAKEDHFGFISRPSPAKVIDPEGAWAEELEAAQS